MTQDTHEMNEIANDQETSPDVDTLTHFDHTVHIIGQAGAGKTVFLADFIDWASTRAKGVKKVHHIDSRLIIAAQEIKKRNWLTLDYKTQSVTPEYCYVDTNDGKVIRLLSYAGEDIAPEENDDKKKTKAINYGEYLKQQFQPGDVVALLLNPWMFTQELANRAIVSMVISFFQITENKITLQEATQKAFKYLFGYHTNSNNTKNNTNNTKNNNVKKILDNICQYDQQYVITRDKTTNQWGLCDRSGIQLTIPFGFKGNPSQFINDPDYGKFQKWVKDKDDLTKCFEELSDLAYNMQSIKANFYQTVVDEARDQKCKLIVQFTHTDLREWIDGVNDAYLLETIDNYEKTLEITDDFSAIVDNLKTHVSDKSVTKKGITTVSLELRGFNNEGPIHFWGIALRMLSVSSIEKECEELKRRLGEKDYEMTQMKNVGCGKLFFWSLLAGILYFAMLWFTVYVIQNTPDSTSILIVSLMATGIFTCLWGGLIFLSNNLSQLRN